MAGLQQPDDWVALTRSQQRRVVEVLTDLFVAHGAVTQDDVLSVIELVRAGGAPGSPPRPRAGDDDSLV